MEDHGDTKQHENDMGSWFENHVGAYLMVCRRGMNSCLAVLVLGLPQYTIQFIYTSLPSLGLRMSNVVLSTCSM